jgi:ADP-ribosyltransferase exoenzyme
MKAKSEHQADTSDFVLLASLRPEEQEVLAHYKDFSDHINCALRGGTLDEKLTRWRDALDSAVQKGRTTRPLILYRATCAHYIPAVVGTAFQDLAFVSTSLCPEGLVAFYCADAPAKLVIDYPTGSPLACFPCDSGGGGENERLLPRGAKFRVMESREIEDRSAILREQCAASDRGQLYLQTGTKLLILHVGVV